MATIYDSHPHVLALKEALAHLSALDTEGGVTLWIHEPSPELSAWAIANATERRDHGPEIVNGKVTRQPFTAVSLGTPIAKVRAQFVLRDRPPAPEAIAADPAAHDPAGGLA